jgi:hypothetical protein
VINPLVPFDFHAVQDIALENEGGKHLSDKGVEPVANQVLRIMLHSGLQYHVKQVRRSHPQVDIILIEPSQQDYKMFFNNIMRYSARLAVAQHGFESVTLDLAEDYQMYKDVLSRHDIPITRRLVIDELAEIASSGNDPQVIQRVLTAVDQETGCTRRRGSRPLCKLDRALDDLNRIISDMENSVALR